MMPSFEPSSQMIILIASAFLALAVTLLFVTIRASLADKQRIKSRLSVTEGQSEGRIFESTKRAQAKIVQKLGQIISLPEADKMTKIRFKLTQAGFFGSESVKTYYAARLICLALPLTVLMPLWALFAAQLGASKMALIACTAMILGLVVPSFYLDQRIKKRTEHIRQGFPDMMDLVVACIEAGLSLDAALLRVSDEVGPRYPALKANLDILNLELRAGQDRHVGMNNFAARTNLDEAKALAVMLKQAEEMGSSLGTALRSFSEEMRHKRLMKAEEKAMALAAKMTVPLILFIFPSIMALLLLPAGIRVVEGL